MPIAASAQLHLLINFRRSATFLSGLQSLDPQICILWRLQFTTLGMNFYTHFWLLYFEKYCCGFVPGFYVTYWYFFFLFMLLLVDVDVWLVMDEV